jgi:hypothetical protein
MPGFSELDPQRQIIAYALLFRYAQQLGTQFINNRTEQPFTLAPPRCSE